MSERWAYRFENELFLGGMMPTKAELELERDQLLTRLEEAYVIIGDALGYEDAGSDENEEADEDEEEGD